MKILVLVSSLRKQGNTDLAADILKDYLYKEAAAQSDKIEIETVYLGEMQIRPCRGCRVCFDRGEDCCPCKDDIPALKEKIKAADALVAASPVYVDDVNGIMKNFIDRLAHICHRPEFAAKSAYLLVTVGSSRTSHALRTLDTALRTWGFSIIGAAGFKTHARMERKRIEELYGTKLSVIAGQIYEHTKNERYKNPSFLSLMFFRILQIGWSKAEPGTIDYRYWKENHWLDKHAKFYLEPHSSPLKVAAARLVGSIIARVMV